jgi:hypothetical protein
MFNWRPPESHVTIWNSFGGLENFQNVDTTQRLQFMSRNALVYKVVKSVVKFNESLLVISCFCVAKTLSFHFQKLLSLLATYVVCLVKYFYKLFSLYMLFPLVKRNQSPEILRVTNTQFVISNKNGVNTNFKPEINKQNANKRF